MASHKIAGEEDRHKHSKDEIAYMLKAVRFAVQVKHAELLVLAETAEALERKMKLAQEKEKEEEEQ